MWTATPATQRVVGRFTLSVIVDVTQSIRLRVSGFVLTPWCLPISFQFANSLNRASYVRGPVDQRKKWVTAKCRIYRTHEFQRVPLTYLVETVANWNSYVDKGRDPEFGRRFDAPMYRIEKPPFYAATLYPVWHDSYGGLRINGRVQVIDMHGEPIPALYAGGESSGGGNQHGLGRALVHGYIAGHKRRQGTGSS